MSAPDPSSNRDAKVLIKNFGCKSNWADAASLQQAFFERGLGRAPTKGADSAVEVCVVNSCTVTEEADRESRREVRRLRRRYPNAKIVFTGCGAEVDPVVPGADHVIGNSSKTSLVDRVLGRSAPIETWPRPSNLAVNPEFAGKTRSFLKVQEGCERFCTYCIIPYGRGPNRALSVDEVVELLKRTAEQGTPEAVLTGTNLGNLGHGPMIELVERIDRDLRTPFRVRLSSLDPEELSDPVIDALNGSHILCAHAHIALQSPHPRTLRRMKRGYGAKEIARCFRRLSIYPDCFIGMDVITGFPGESDGDFTETVNMLSDLPWTRLHVFPYSERRGTPALRLKEVVPSEVRKERAQVLMTLSLSRQRAWTSRFLGHSLKGVLFEAQARGPDGSDRWQSGYSRNYIRVLAREAPSLASVRVTDLVVDPVRQDVTVLGSPVP